MLFAGLPQLSNEPVGPLSGAWFTELPGSR